MARRTLARYLAIVLSISLVPASVRAAVECFQEIELVVEHGGTFSVDAADFDGDGDQDLVVADGSMVFLYDNDGATPPGFVAREVPNEAGARRPYPVDLDGDGDIDIVVPSGSHTNSSYWLDNDGTAVPSFAIRPIPSIGGEDEIESLADIDGDGSVDILTFPETQDEVVWHENLGGSPLTFAAHLIDMDVDEVNALWATDLDGDGDQDVVAAYDGDNSVVWHENLGGSPPAFVEHLLDADTLEVVSLVAADADGDGDVDVLAPQTNGDLTRYENDGGSPPSFVRVDFARFSDPWRLVPVDLDGDGDLDIAVATGGQGFESRGSLFWLENEGSLPPVYSNRTISNLRVNSYSLTTADLDADGDLDVIGGWFDRFGWFEHSTVPDGPLVLAQTPIVRGETATFEVRSVEADDTATVYYSLEGEGEGPCSPGLGGLCLDLLPRVQVLGTAAGGPACGARLNVDVPNVPFSTVSAQAVVRRGPGGADSVKSNVTTAPVEGP